MTESEYWLLLEHRICHELKGMSEGRLSRLWCDGVTGGAYFLADDPPSIRGHAWICQGDAQAEWRLELLIPHPAASRAEIDWAALLPPCNVTRWLSLDREKRIVKIEPAVAVPDLIE